MNLMGKAMRLNPHHPGWYHIVAFMTLIKQIQRTFAEKSGG
ncbi:hypothetical protein D1AOALGA4SA_4261 [Olavius algarvensis Delta 1 endosymbiont]|nr:hypothetical protein D1AOALGA4SA_4261 [Olavius algarvensis Delta 1 endosymbiont]